MDFISISYLLFFPLISLLYFLLPYRFRWILLLVGSYFFYACWNIKYALLMLLSTVVTYAGGLLIYRLEDKRKLLSEEPGNDKKALLKIHSRKKAILIATLVINLGILFFFKYFNFVNSSFAEVFEYFHMNWGFDNLNILLPVGISFYTFQALSYTLDVYYGRTEATTHFGKFALYVSFFPQLVAGPIERSWHLLPQFSKKIDFDYRRMKEGIFLIIEGIFKKVVIADRLAVVVNQVYGAPEEHYGVEVIVATIFFAFQIYCDFSAYTDIARGSARVMGFDLMKNFRRPYFATSIPEFWRRWHISLTTWFRDYLYIPLGGNRVGKYRRYSNIMIVFLVSGLWHGAAWTFLIWGFIHGIFQLIDIQTKKVRLRFNENLRIRAESIDVRFFKVMWTFFLTCFAWLFFRAASFADAITLIRNATVYNPWTIFDGSLFELGLDAKDFIFGIVAIAILLIMWIVESRSVFYKIIAQQHYISRWLIYTLIVIFIIVFGFYGSQYEKSQFIYFQF